MILGGVERGFLEMLGNVEVWIVIFLRAGDFFDLYFDQSLSKMIIDRFE